MTVPSPARRLIGAQRIPRSAAGLSMVELMIVVLIISMLFLAAIPAYQRIQRKARAATIANDFRVFGAVFQAYAHEKGMWPAETPSGVLPPGISAEEIQTATWTNITPMGGKFDWENELSHASEPSDPDGHWRAAVAITAPADGSAPLVIDAELMREIDESLDDGDLDTGNFRRGFGDCPILIIEP